MKVVGFSIVKNAVLYDYPIVQALQSILPVCDEVIVAVGDSTDETWKVVSNMNPKIKPVQTQWDKTPYTGGQLLAVETNKAFQMIDTTADWCFYIQADEVLHEKYVPVVLEALKKYQHDAQVDGLLFKYLHFYGSYDYVGSSSTWYRNEIRVIKNNKKIYSYKDAQGFRKEPNTKLNVKPIDAFIHHYGWVREPKKMHAKHTQIQTLYSGKPSPLDSLDTTDFDYGKIDSLVLFKGTHPQVMLERIKNKNWTFKHNIAKNQLSIKDWFKNILERCTGRRFFDYQNYKII